MEVKSIIQYLFELPKFDVQKEFCRSLMSLPNLHEILYEVIAQWDAIPSNRKDKFFYLVSLILPKVDYDILGIRNTELRNYCIKSKFVLDEEMIKYAATCKYKSTLMAIRDSISKVDCRLGALALELGRERSLMQANREVLYQIYSLSQDK